MHEMEYIRECHDKGMILWLKQKNGLKLF
jgi:hypothetical protein